MRGAGAGRQRSCVGAGDRVGIRLPSGGAELYLAILAVLAVGAAYLPVDADDPDERAEIVWTRADVIGVLTAGSGSTAAARRSLPSRRGHSAWDRPATPG